MLVSLQETFIRAQLWLKELEKQYTPGSTVIWLVGNKGDLAQDRQVSVQVQTEKNHLPKSHIYIMCYSMTCNFWSLYVVIQEGQTLSNDRGLFFTETSALSGEQISELLVAVGK